MNPKIIVVALALLCGGCASRAVPDAANDFKEATADFTKGLSAIDADAQAADLARENALALQSVGPAETITVLETCRESVLAAQKQYKSSSMPPLARRPTTARRPTRALRPIAPSRSAA